MYNCPRVPALSRCRFDSCALLLSVPNATAPAQVIHEWLRAADRPDQQRLALGIVRNCTLNGVTLTPVLPVVVDCLLSDAPTVRRQAACCIRVGHPVCSSDVSIDLCLNSLEKGSKLSCRSRHKQSNVLLLAIHVGCMESAFWRRPWRAGRTTGRT